MSPDGIEGRVLAALEEGASAQGLDIVSVETSGPKSHPTLQVRIDTLEGGPIDMDRVAEATPWVSSVLDAIDPFPGPWELEVSSPGIDRPLRRLSDFAAFVGQRAEVTVAREDGGVRTIVGVIARAEDGVVALDADGEVVEAPIAQVRKARLKPDFDAIMAAAKKASKAAKGKGRDEGPAPDDPEDLEGFDEGDGWPDEEA